ncbi:NAD(P)H-binding protein [Roseicella aerolata]|uniref:NADH-ubiquinone oxidoreductase n=1 Tax=Roseicella aerolata TaxID=2883479 RepID=A0A9X1LDM7_9PROT|nr:NADH-ubiquinone oxidoreductase [Roseicella aerolata]MCB4825475.1 NADH-ubiquinone oxidoreductase [Roseicella aerolata]
MTVRGSGGVIHVIGATGRSGLALCRALAAAGEDFVPVLRDAARWQALGLPGMPRLADLRDPAALRAALRGAGRVAACTHARWTPAILAATEPATPLVLMGSTRRFSRWPDAHGDGVRAGEAALLASGRPGIMLHPTMIYGAEGENNVQRLAALMRRLPVAPLPAGGAALVQPIYQEDVTRCLLAALRRPLAGPETLVIAGPEPVPYREFLRQVARAAGLRPPPVLSIPAMPLRLLAPLSRLVPGLPTIGADEIRRLTEDKAFEIGPMRAALGVSPIPLAEGLARTFAAGPPERPGEGAGPGRPVDSMGRQDRRTDCVQP